MDRTGEVSRPFSLERNTNTLKLNMTQGSSLEVQLIFNNGSFIIETVTITRPINFNGGTIRCNNDMLTLNIPANTGKFLVTGIGN